MLRFALGFVNNNYRELKELVRSADVKLIDAHNSQEKLGVKYELSMTDSLMVDFLGVEYTVEKSDLTNGNWFKYSSIPATFTIPLFNHSIAIEEIALPEAYLIPVEWTEVIEKLKYHNIEMYQEDIFDSINVEVYRFSNTSWGKKPFEGRHRVKVDYALSEELMSFPNGVMVEVIQFGG